MVYSEATQILARPLILAAGLLGTIQGICWTVLSIVSICAYNNEITNNDNSVNYGYTIFMIYFDSSTTGYDNIITPKAFNIFSYLYMIFSFLWLIFSAFLIWVIIRNKWSKCLDAVILWTITVAIISILDLILMSLIAADLNNFDNTATIPASDTVNITTNELALLQASKLIILTSYGIVMTVAAKGFLLWIANVIFVIVLALIAFKMHKEERPSLLPFIDAYATGSLCNLKRPNEFELFVSDADKQNLNHRPPQSQFDTSKGNVNNGYQPDDTGIFSRGQSAAFPYNKGNQQRLSNNPLANNYNNVSTSPVRPSMESNFSFSKPIERKEPPPKVAKIGKSGGGKKSPSQNVSSPYVPPLNGPYIPDPDYSPPGSPKNNKPTKSSLRPRSNYVL